MSLRICRGKRQRQTPCSLTPDHFVRRAKRLLFAAVPLRQLLLLSAIVLISPDVASADEPLVGRERAELLFARQVLPVLREKCLACHGARPDGIKGELSLASRAAMLRGGESGEPSLVAGKSGDSLLIQAIRWDGLEMPPKANDRLSERQIGFFAEWIDLGAPWPNEARLKELENKADPWSRDDGIAVATSGGLSPEWTRRKYDEANLWAYRPLQSVSVPEAAAEAASHPIDAFLNQARQTVGLPAAPRADRRTLIRRATYDLTGLPPTPAEVARFQSDPRNDRDAFAAVVERLLDSPHFGEQWGRHWLDVVRYADSSGYANDFERANAWRYRDYVIRAFNSDKPFDQFVREQIAGDEVNPDDPEMLVAVGFLRMGPWELTGMEVARVARQRFLDDVTDAVGQVFLSHPLQCARCHDHKFDPLPTRDYYRLQAVFATTQLAEREAPFLPQENTEGFDERRYLRQRQKRYQQSLERLSAKRDEATRQWYADRGLKYIPRNEALKKGLPPDQIPPRHVGFEPEDFGLERVARKGLQRLEWELDRYEPYALSVYSGRTPILKAVYEPFRMPADRMQQGQLEQGAILAGGDPFSPIQEVKPGVLSILSGLSTTASTVADRQVLLADGIEGRRTELAEWIASPDNPLTVRSIVNRIWYWHFGQAIAGNPNNFGAMGQKPTHPELLDWLARRFLNEGWSIKQLHRLIMSSDAYCRSAEHPQPQQLEELDPQRQLYATFRPRRLTAEEIRDSMLAVSGELNRTLGGIPVRPDMNLEAALQPRMVMGTFAPAWQASPRPEQRNRRSIYALQLRGLRDPFMDVFNQPSPEFPCEARESSTVTPQVFTLLNSRNSLHRAVAFAVDLLQLDVEDPEVIREAYRRLYGREVDVDEQQACLDHWRQMAEQHQRLTFSREHVPLSVERDAVEENTGEKFRFVEQLDFNADYVPDKGYADVDARTRGLAEVCLVLLNSSEFVYVD